MYEFNFKPFEEMTDEDYNLIGFKSGLEIHQQLLTEKKLFCRCPAGRYNNKYDAEILRHMRPTLSELGEYDGTALMEFKTKKNIIYRINRETVCTYEMDDTPPFLINEQALEIAVGCGILLDCKIVDEMHIIRKQYLDGSIPTGFQRTAIFAVDGKIPYKDREIDIMQVSIEEDSCREISDYGHDRIYNTDRLGMPLIETVTAPQMRTPVEVAEVGQICRRLVRSTGNVRTGIGAGREDVNVSVTGGTRIEIKGVPKLSRIPLLTYNEAMRQWNLLKLKEELKSRGITEENFNATAFDVTNLVRKSYYQPVRLALQKNWLVKCVVLKGFKKLLNWQTQTDTYFSKEISDRVRVIACLTNLPNLIHSDSKGDSLSSADWQKIKKHCSATDNDTLVLVWGNEIDSETAVKEIIIRAKEATIGIPSETRQALHDGTNGFERILPGPDRMYPDTDLPPKRITRESLEKIKTNLPKQIWLNEKWYKELGIPEDTIEPLAVSRYNRLFESLVLEMNIDPVFAAVVLVQFVKRLARKKLNVNKLTPEVMKEIFTAYKDGKIVKDSFLYIMEMAASDNNFSINYIPSPASLSELQQIKNHCEIELSRMSFYEPHNRGKVLMGLIMNRLRLRINGKQVNTNLGNLSGENL